MPPEPKELRVTASWAEFRPQKQKAGAGGRGAARAAWGAAAGSTREGGGRAAHSQHLEHETQSHAEEYNTRYPYTPSLQTRRCGVHSLIHLGR